MITITMITTERKRNNDNNTNGLKTYLEEEFIKMFVGCLRLFAEYL